MFSCPVYWRLSKPQKGLAVIPISMRRRYDFGSDRAVVGSAIESPEAWDALRLQTSGPFGVPSTREALEAAADERPDLQTRAAAINAVVAAAGGRSVASYGVGAGLMEFWMLRTGGYDEFTMTEYAPGTVDRLRALVPEATVRQHDMLADPPVSADVHLFHRVDAEFSNRQWRRLADRFASATILLVASEIADLERLKIEVRYRIHARNASRAGWLRNREAFDRLWRRTHDAEPTRFGDADGWVLTPR